MYRVKEIVQVDVEYPPLFGMLISIRFHAFTGCEPVSARLYLIHGLQHRVQFLLQYFDVRIRRIDLPRCAALFGYVEGRVPVLFRRAVDPVVEVTV